MAYRLSSVFLHAVLILSAPLLGCAGKVPKQLTAARKAYQGAAQGPAAEFTPAQLQSAQQSLTLAEQTYEDEGDSHRTTDRAYVAMRKAQLADARARSEMIGAKIALMEQRLADMRAAQLEEARSQLEQEEQRRKQAEEQVQRTAQELSDIANVRQDARGTIITLSGPVLFANNQSQLTPGAKRRLDQVAKALQNGIPESQIVVEGHTDSRGSADYNLELSAKRAQAVRDYLVSQGVDASQVSAQGLGLTRPIGDNTTAQGRANNRRVEIVVQPEGGG